MSIVEVPGAQLDADIGGHGPTLVQLHGLGASRQRDAETGFDFGSSIEGVRLVRYDARGHGLSSGRAHAQDYDWSNLADDFVAVLANDDDSWASEPVHAVGASMGAATLVMTMARRPELFHSVTLVIPPTVWETRRAQRNLYLEAAQLVERRGLKVYTRAVRRVPPPPAASAPMGAPDISEELFPDVMRGAAATDLPPKQALGAALAQIDFPVQIFAWADDPAHPVSTAVELQKLIPHARVTVCETPQEMACISPAIQRQISMCEDTRRA